MNVKAIGHRMMVSLLLALGALPRTATAHSTLLVDQSANRAPETAIQNPNNIGVAHLFKRAALVPEHPADKLPLWFAPPFYHRFGNRIALRKLRSERFDSLNEYAGGTKSCPRGCQLNRYYRRIYAFKVRYVPGTMLPRWSAKAA